MARDDSAHVHLPPDPVIEVYKKDIDRGLLRENLKLTVERRLIKLQNLMDAMDSSRCAARKIAESEALPQKQQDPDNRQPPE